MANPCRFCRGTGRQITKEHVWPKWLADFLPGMAPLGHAERWSSDAGRERFQQPFLSATVRAFCDSCNNGWMSAVEAAAKPIAGPMVTGQAVELDADAQRIVASWVALKGLVAVLTSKTEQPVPESHYHRVWAARGAPENTMRVWLGHRQNLADPARIGRATLFSFNFMPVTDVFPQFPLWPDMEQYRADGGVFNGTVFQIGHFFALALQHDWPGLQARPKPNTVAANALCRSGPPVQTSGGHRPGPSTCSATLTR